MAATLRHSTKPYHLKLFFSNLNTHAQVCPKPCDMSFSPHMGFIFEGFKYIELHGEGYRAKYPRAPLK